ncbi:HDOD domain-containing protein [Undibacterium amnicola]|uniref:HDOD domain-containing protein n=1 Tax=Undibacterium amnicola TaxID=1834038 RepID=A0ABR6XPE7_9BURK|nr:HDOD domain-containing protein [Undibacterium amnicola]MBC3831371.1 HDOD domain-containing protein [Undibacterium amnicola]
MNQRESEFEFIKGLSAELSSRNLVFPTSLKATMKIRHALDDPDMASEQVARIISTEPVLSAQVLMLSNSAMFNRSSKKIEELRIAVTLLGFSVVRNIAISVGMKQLKDQQENTSKSEQMEGLWTRSMRVAALSYVIARNRTKLSADKAMVAGLLHDIGKFYILSRAHQYQGLFTSDEALWDLIDQWHADIGAAILESWEVSDDIREAVMDRKRNDLPPHSRPTLTDVVAAADFLDVGFVKQSLSEVDWNAVPVALKNLDLNEESAVRLMTETRQEIAQILKVIA